jgi:hypothetical protein
MSDLLSRYADAAPALRRLSARNDPLRATLLTASPERRHAIVMAVLRTSAPDALPGLLSNGSVTDLIAHAYGAGHGLRPAMLRRLGPSPLSVTGYDALARLTANRMLGRQLTHLSASLTRRHVAALSRLPAAFQDARMLRFDDLPHIGDTFELLVGMLLKACPGAGTAEIAASLFATKETSLYDWSERFLLEHAALPEAPHAEQQWLRPLRTGPELASAGKTYQNCLARQVAEVLQGRRHFSIFSDRGTAIVEFRSWQPVGWYVGRLWAPGNKRLAPRLRARGYARLAELGFAARPFALRGDRDYLSPFTAIGLD